MDPYPASTAQWGGRPWMMVILSIYLLTFFAAAALMLRNKSETKKSL
jgi:hypothetical protein